MKTGKGTGKGKHGGKLGREGKTAREGEERGVVKGGGWERQT